MKALSNSNRSLDSSSRRRKLFPCDNNPVDSGLDCVSINFDSDDENQPPINYNNSLSSSDYDILSVLVKTNKQKIYNSETPDQTKLNPKPVESPTKTLKTPQEDILANAKLPKLGRKPHESSPIDLNGTINKNSKVRTALFPDLNMPLPTSTFYPKTSQSTTSHSGSNYPLLLLRKEKIKNKKTYPSGRRNRFGQINAGVKHGIRKPKKPKRLSKEEALEKSIRIIEKSPLNSYLESLEKNKNVSAKEVQNDIYSVTECQEGPCDNSLKSTCDQRSNVKIQSDIKLQVNSDCSPMESTSGSKRRLDQSPENGKRLKLDHCVSFDDNDNEPLISNSQISNILNVLEDNTNKENELNDVLMSPNTSQMCDMASGLAINSPKKMKNLNSVLNNMPNNYEKPEDTELRFFPIFYPALCPQSNKKEVVEGEIRKNQIGKYRGTEPEQMQLDVGQNNFGAYQCPECRLLYHKGDPNDEIMHDNYHKANYVFRFKGWKNERIVTSNHLDTRVIKILPHDPKSWIKKAQEVLEIVNRDLGYFDMGEVDLSKSQIYLYVRQKNIIGVLVAEAIFTAHKLLSSIGDLDVCSETSYPVKCGVSRIWVSSDYRKQGIGTSLMNTLKRNFMFGYFLTNNDIAFSSPTNAGKLFAEAFFKTSNFLVYFNQ